MTVVKSAARAFAVLELFEVERRPLGLREITAALGYPTSSAAALLKSLVALGYLDYDRSRRVYGPTMRMAVLGQWVQETQFGDGAVLAAARRLHDQTGLTVVLATQSDLEAQYLHLIHPGEPMRAQIKPGQLRPLATSGMGWVLLSGQADEAVRRLVRRINYRRTAETRVDLAALFVRLGEVRTRGYAFSRDGVSPGFGLIGALIPASVLGRPMGIGVTGPTSVLTAREDELAAAVLRARGEIVGL